MALKGNAAERVGCSTCRCGSVAKVFTTEPKDAGLTLAVVAIFLMEAESKNFPVS